MWSTPHLFQDRLVRVFIELGREVRVRMFPSKKRPEAREQERQEDASRPIAFKKHGRGGGGGEGGGGGVGGGKEEEGEGEHHTGFQSHILK